MCIVFELIGRDVKKRRTITQHIIHYLDIRGRQKKGTIFTTCCPLDKPGIQPLNGLEKVTDMLAAEAGSMTLEGI